MEKPAVFRTVALATGDVISGMRSMPALFALTFVLMCAWSAVFGPPPRLDPATTQVDGAILISLLSSAISNCFLAPLAVAIHRQVILSETFRFDNLGRLGRPIVYYAICLSVIEAVYEILLLVDPSRDANVSGSFYLLHAVLIFGNLYMIFRIFLLFPAIAVESFESLQATYRMSEGLSLRFCGVYVVANLPMVLAWAVLGLWLGWEAGPEFGGDDVFNALLNVVFLPILVASASRFYLWRVRATKSAEVGRDGSAWAD